jgi:hypothetical protein
MNVLPKVMQRSGLDLHLTPVCPAEGTETYNKNIKKKSMAIDLELATLLARRHYSSSHPLGCCTGLLSELHHPIHLRGRRTD